MISLNVRLYKIYKELYNNKLNKFSAGFLFDNKKKSAAISRYCEHFRRS